MSDPTTNAVIEIDRSRVVNGSVWIAHWPLCLEVVVQWLQGDQWAILGAPAKSTSGGTAMCGVTQGTPVVKNHEQVCALLERWRATQQPMQLKLELIPLLSHPKCGKTLAPVDAESKRAMQKRRKARHK